MGGLSDLRMGALLGLIAYVTLILVFLVFLVSFLFPMITQPVEPLSAITSILSSLLLLGVGLLIGLILAITSFYKFFKATGHLKRFDAPRLGIGRVGVLLQLAALAIMVISTMEVIVMTPYGTVPKYEYSAPLIAFAVLFVAASIVSLMGSLLFGIMLMRLADVEGLSGGFKVAGVLYIATAIMGGLGFILGAVVIGAAIFILGMLAMVVIYTSAGESLRKLASLGSL